MPIGSTPSELSAQLLSGGFVAVFAWFVFKALRTGRIIPTRADRAYVRNQEPAAFWFHVVGYTIIACAFLPAAAVNPRLMELGFAALVAYFALNAVKIGKVKPSIHDRISTRSADPGTYWFHVVVLVVLACALVTAAIWWA